jgi:hypothetical protein
MDKLDRAIQRSEERFFDECDTRNGEFILSFFFFELTTCPVPVIVLYTKFDALLARGMVGLSRNDQRLPREERVAKAYKLIDGIFEDANVWGRLSQLKYAPNCGIRIGGNILFYNK